MLRWQYGPTRIVTGRDAVMIQYPTDPQFIAAMTDANLLAAYKRATGPQNDEEATRLSAEIEQRGLDI